MNYSITVKNNKINVLLSIFITSTLLLSSLGISSSAFAQPSPFVLVAKNTANQGISQAQSSAQNALCLSGALSGAACNNTNIQGQANSGGNTAGQSATGGHGKSSGGSNTANQGISQAQSSAQFAQCVAAGKLKNSCKGPNAQCVSGESAQVSCNQEEWQKLINSGKIATANLSK